ncbi:MAG: radical SAM family heme chaperone HemW [Melioribacter sp.]|uniref:radical SAM family heme chaperone HemW n=1 Tax=Rosettibacter primus TaxID=3111523 RepID=UPI00247D3BDD|nr:radical SAM family heme chaperone HemW [Melioribacter sp.]
MKETSIYIHIPYCEHKCIYCDFYSIITNKNTGEYLKALKKEINFFADKYSNDRKILSIYFGGGTPSLMAPPFFYELINFISQKFHLCSDAEITIEANPGTLNKNKLKSFKNIGINRLSIGTQSFDNNELKFLTRIHDSQTAIKTVMEAKDSNFENISIDLIFNLPNQTKKIWMNNLTLAVSLPIKHLSAYSLILEPGTILNKMVKDGKVKIQDEDYDADLYELTIDFLTHNGFIQYEVSNFTKPGFECVHNNSYWKYKDYLGFGTSSHSFVEGKRWWNYSSLSFYLESINKKNHAVAGEEILTKSQMLNEYVMLALRSSGLDTVDFIRRFGSSWLKERESLILEMIKNGFMGQDEKKIKLTAKGYAICDEIIKNLV